MRVTAKHHLPRYLRQTKATFRARAILARWIEEATPWPPGSRHPAWNIASPYSLSLSLKVALFPAQVTWTRAVRGWATTRAPWVPCAARRCSSWSAGDGSRRRRSCRGRVSPAWPASPCRRRRCHARVRHHRDPGCQSRTRCTCRWTPRTPTCASSPSGSTTPSTTIVRSSTRRCGPARACRRASVIRTLIGLGRGVIATSPS